MQGLTATTEQLGANAAETATEFGDFEDLLLLSTTGGWQVGGPGTIFSVAQHWSRNLMSSCQ